MPKKEHSTEFLVGAFFKLLITVLGVVLAVMGNSLVGNLDRMANSIQELNSRVATVVEKVEGHELRIEYLEQGKPKALPRNSLGR